MTFLDAQADWRSAPIRHLQGDASSRSYARLFGEGKTVLLMDAPRQPDGPPIRDGRPYSQIAHLAEDIRAFSAIGAALREAELSAPAILAEDLDKGLMLLEDLGQRIFGVEVERDPSAPAQLWTAAVDALLALHLRPVPERLPLRNGSAHALPAYDRGALTIELELLLDWYWPAVHGARVADDARAAFLAAWDPVIDRLLHVPQAWVLRDFHSPNLIWLPGREGIRRVGVIDFQDAQRGPAAYDLVSLLQDARVDVPEALEAELLQRYCDSAMNADARFNEPEFRFAYAALGAQRSTKILGIFVRLARRDGKPQYLAHLPRLWGYLQRDLAKPELASLAAWYDQYLPPAARTGRLPALNAAG
jgi:aminoglycoside/choline kinase family phosphotransferase